MRFIDLMGKRFGRLVVVGPRVIRGYASLYVCECDCGKLATVYASNLRKGATASCGCSRVTHGHVLNGKPSPTYLSWQHMRDRCLNKNFKQYADYGGRGIKICENWNSFENFLEDMGIRPDGMTLDRKDNSGHYYKENCRWSTRREQQGNRRSSRLITVNGITLCCSEWARRAGIKTQTLIGRLNAGCPADLAVSTERFAKGCLSKAKR